MKIMVETSARHIHVTQEALEVLFGKGYQMTFRKALSQPGQFATNERVTVVGPKRSFENVSILGPARKACQVELSLTDARSIGVDAPVRESGKIEGSAGCKLIGPAGELELKEGVIVAKRHIHMSPEAAAEMGLKSGDIVKVAMGAEGRKTIFDDVVIRTGEGWNVGMHIDTDEANACGGADEGEIIVDGLTILT